MRRPSLLHGIAGLSVAAILVGACTSAPDDDELAEARAELADNVAFVSQSWPTDWTNSTVDLGELLLGVSATEPRDAIPPIDEPKYESPDQAADWLDDREPGALVRVADEVRFFPLAIMTRHEIVNDEIAGVPVAVTYCPLCNTALTFDRRIEGSVLRFGVSGLLRNSDLVMWDDTSVSLWQQITGEALVGQFAGLRLEPVSTAIVRFGDFRSSFPDGLSLSRDTGFGLQYGVNPYDNYTDRLTPLIPVGGELDNRFPALERVVGVSVGGTDKAYPFSVLRLRGAVNDEVAGEPIVVLWGSPDTADPLDEELTVDGDGIGTAIAFDPRVGGEVLTFAADGDGFRDAETASQWTVLGHAVAGPLAGTQLETVTHRNEFWFAWTAFFPDADVFGG